MFSTIVADWFAFEDSLARVKRVSANKFRVDAQPHILQSTNQTNTFA